MPYILSNSLVSVLDVLIKFRISIFDLFCCPFLITLRPTCKAVGSSTGQTTFLGKKVLAGPLFWLKPGHFLIFSRDFFNRMIF